MENSKKKIFRDLKSNDKMLTSKQTSANNVSPQKLKVELIEEIVSF